MCHLFLLPTVMSLFYCYRLPQHPVMCVCVCVRAGRSVCLECIWACTCAHPVCGEWGRDGLTDRVKRESALSQTRDFSMTCSPWHALYLRRLSELYSSVSINFSRVNASLQRGNGKTLKQPLSLSLFLSFFLFFFCCKFGASSPSKEKHIHVINDARPRWFN